MHHVISNNQRIAVISYNKIIKNSIYSKGYKVKVTMYTLSSTSMDKHCKLIRTASSSDQRLSMLFGLMTFTRAWSALPVSYSLSCNWTKHPHSSNINHSSKLDFTLLLASQKARIYFFTFQYFVIKISLFKDLRTTQHKSSDLLVQLYLELELVIKFTHASTQKYQFCTQLIRRRLYFQAKRVITQIWSIIIILPGTVKNHKLRVNIRRNALCSLEMWH